MGYEACEIQTLERYVNILQSGSKREKKTAIEHLMSVVNEAQGDVLLEVHRKLQNQLILSLQDPMELVREGALDLSLSMIERLDVDKSHISLLIPALYPRVCRDKDYETSEELRLKISSFLIVLVEKYDKLLSPYITELVDMVCRLFKDPCPDIKQSTSKLLIKFVKTLPYETYHLTKKILPPLADNITHQRWRVRVASIEAVEWLMIKGDNKCVPDVTPVLNKKMLDSNYQVRLALVRLAGHWAVALPDRYSFFAHLIPIILSGLADDTDEIIQEATDLWIKAGNLYLKENEESLKDKINYEPEELDHYPPGIIRPSLGCRILIEREASKFLLALTHELTDWVEIVRIKASMLLAQVTLHYEHSITMCIHKIISQMCKGAIDRETPLVVYNVKRAAEFMGYFVPPKTYCELIVDYMKECHEGDLLIVAALIRGSRRSDLVDNLDNITLLFDPNTFKGRRQRALLELIESILNLCQSDSFRIGDKIWASLVTVAGLSETDMIKMEAIRLLEKFADLGGGNKREVYEKYCGHLLKRLPDSVWYVHCYEQFILNAVINVTGEVVEQNLDLIVETLRGALKQDNDPEVLLKIMMSINDLLDNAGQTLPSEETMSKFVTAMLSDLLPPHLKWSAGRSAEAIRTIASTCLYMCLCKVHNTGLGPYIAPLLPLILSLLQDPSAKTRLLALSCLKLFSNNSIPHEVGHFSNIIGEVVKRLDDVDKSVRSLAVQVIRAYYNQHIVIIPKEQMNQTLASFVYGTLLIHLDDKDPSLQQLVLECLKTMSSIDAESLRSKVLLDNFRDKDICKNLLDFLESKLADLNIK